MLFVVNAVLEIHLSSCFSLISNSKGRDQNPRSKVTGNVITVVLCVCILFLQQSVVVFGAVGAVQKRTRAVRVPPPSAAIAVLIAVAVFMLLKLLLFADVSRCRCCYFMCNKLGVLLVCCCC